MNWKFWKKKPVKISEPFITDVIDVNKIAIVCKLPEMGELLKLLKKDRDQIMRLEMGTDNNDKTALRKGEVIAYNMIIANISEVRKEEIVYARKSDGSTSK